MTALRDLFRALGTDPDEATARQRLAGVLLLLTLIVAAGTVAVR